jgi:hypothetical protein
MTVHKESAELAPPRGDPQADDRKADDRKDWIAIIVIVAASSLLLWVPFFV